MASANGGTFYSLTTTSFRLANDSAFRRFHITFLLFCVGTNEGSVQGDHDRAMSLVISLHNARSLSMGTGDPSPGVIFFFLSFFATPCANKATFIGCFKVVQLQLN